MQQGARISMFEVTYFKAEMIMAEFLFEGEMPGGGTGNLHHFPIDFEGVVGKTLFASQIGVEIGGIIPPEKLDPTRIVGGRELNGRLP